MKTIVKIPFTTPLNRSTTMDALIECINGIYYIYFPTQCIHNLYNITQYDINYYIGDSVYTTTINPYYLLACTERKDKDNLYYEYSLLNIPVTSKPIRFEVSCSILEEVPEWLDGVGTGVLQGENSDKITLTHDIDNIFVNLGYNHMYNIFDQLGYDYSSIRITYDPENMIDNNVINILVSKISTDTTCVLDCGNYHEDIFNSYNSISDELYNELLNNNTINIISNGPIKITRYLFGGSSPQSNIYNIELNNTVQELALYSLASTNIRNIIIPNSVISLGENVFDSCLLLESISFPTSIDTLTSGMCIYCDSLTDIYIPDNITRIEYNVFRGCTSLENITLPNNISYIGYNTFYDCTSLEVVDLSNLNTGVVPTLGNNVFYNTPDNLKIIVPEDMIELFKNSTNWSVYEDKIVGSL